VWDTGTYANITFSKGEQVPMPRALERGHVTVWLKGHKLSGGYALTRVGRGSEERWLLVKKKDAHSDARGNPVSTQPESVLSGRKVEDLATADESPPCGT
jgi:hypothetical protein